MIDRSFLEYVATLGRESLAIEVQEIDGIKYANRQLTALKPWSPTELKVHTLTGLVNYLQSNPDTLDAVVVHIADFDRVEICSPLHETFQTRRSYVEARPVVDAFRFGSWLNLEEFIIQLQARFAPTEHVAAILKLVGNLSDGTVKQYTDDGVTQGVTAKTGIARVEEVAVPPRVELAPYRTFLEVAQPVSEFVFRLRPGQSGQPPTAALFESDGGFWKLEAIENIRVYLEESLSKSTTIIA